MKNNSYSYDKPQLLDNEQKYGTVNTELWNNISDCTELDTTHNPAKIRTNNKLQKTNKNNMINNTSGIAGAENS